MFESENMKKVSKSTIVGAVISVVLAIISFAVIPYYKSGITEYNSILDKYLNFFTITFIVVSTVAIAGFAVVSLICFIVIILRRNKMKNKTPKIISAILVTVFLVINIVPHIGMAVIKANESREQTEFKKICDEIPVNYEVQLSDFNNEVSTECIYITKPDL